MLGSLFTAFLYHFPTLARATYCLLVLPWGRWLSTQVSVLSVESLCGHFYMWLHSPFQSLPFFLISLATVLVRVWHAKIVLHYHNHPIFFHTSTIRASGASNRQSTNQVRPTKRSGSFKQQNTPSSTPPSWYVRAWSWLGFLASTVLIVRCKCAFGNVQRQRRVPLRK